MTMNSVRQKNMWSIVLIFCFILCFSGCLDQFSVNSVIDEENQDFVQSDIGQIKILKVEPSIIQFIQSNYPDSLLIGEEVISANSDSEIRVGNEYLGFCQLNFKNGTLAQDVPIKIQWNINDGKFIVEFSPDDLTFLQSVELQMSYQLAQLKDVSEDKLKLLYYNENENIWQVIGGVSDAVTKIFTANITHFSRYALAHSQ